MMHAQVFEIGARSGQRVRMRQTLQRYDLEGAPRCTRWYPLHYKPTAARGSEPARGALRRRGLLAGGARHTGDGLAIDSPPPRWHGVMSGVVADGSRLWHRSARAGASASMASRGSQASGSATERNRDHPHCR